ncbi:hypothetical protein AAC387_Pa02g4793 [Persea americana]
MEEEQSLTAKKDSFPDPVKSFEDILITIPGALAHLIDRQRSIKIGAGYFSTARLHQGNNTVAVLACVGGCDHVQWPLTEDVVGIKLDDSHYFLGDPKKSKRNHGMGFLPFSFTSSSSVEFGLRIELGFSWNAFTELQPLGIGAVGIHDFKHIDEVPI